MVGSKTEKVQSSSEHQVFAGILTDFASLHIGWGSPLSKEQQKWGVVAQAKSSPQGFVQSAHTAARKGTPLYLHCYKTAWVAQCRLLYKAFPAPTIWCLYLMQKPFLASNKFLLLCSCSSAELWWGSVQRWCVQGKVLAAAGKSHLESNKAISQGSFFAYSSQVKSFSQELSRKVRTRNHQKQECKKSHWLFMIPFSRSRFLALFCVYVLGSKIHCSSLCKISYFMFSRPIHISLLIISVTL